MRTRTKVWLIIAASLVLIGCVLFAGIMTTIRWDFIGLATVKYETNTYEISEAFDSISINTDTPDITFALSNNGKCTVVCYEEENAAHSVTVKDGALSVTLIDNQSVHSFIALNFDSPEITIYLPQAEYASLFIREDTGDIEIPKDFIFQNAEISLSTGNVDFCASVSEIIKVKTSTGDIRVENISAGALDLSASTGKTLLSDIACKNIIANGSTGDISLNNVIATEKFSIERSTGDVKFNGSDAAEIFVKTDTGDVTGTLLTDKVFITQTDTGSIDVPKTAAGGKCEINTDTGDIRITVG